MRQRLRNAGLLLLGANGSFSVRSKSAQPIEKIWLRGPVLKPFITPLELGLKGLGIYPKMGGGRFVLKVKIASADCWVGSRMAKSLAAS